MIPDIHTWTADFEKELQKCFGSRLWFFGLQGSYARGEANTTSDIDAVVILNTADSATLEDYRRLLDKNPCRELLCGFVAGRKELFCWEKADLLQLYLDTVPVYGSLEELKNLFSRDDIRRSVLTGACNVYHGCLHNFLHGRNTGMLAGLYKQACFTVRMKHYLENGEYIPSMAGLEAAPAGAISSRDRKILETRRLLATRHSVPEIQNSEHSFDAFSNLLREWAEETINTYGP